MSGNEFKIRIGLEKPGVDDGLKESRDELRQMGDEARKASGAAKPALDSIGVSAKQTAAALRGVPAQFTDIVTALQGGQAPLTVLLQQGGQLKDMFGGVGNAARALGGYVAGLATPLTLAAAGVGLVAYAFRSGAQEQEAFTRTLILSGNVASVTAGQLQDMAAKVAHSTGATRGLSAEVMDGVVASGKVSISMLERVSQAAIDPERVGGPAINETVKQFASLGDDPVKASLKLNEQTHYLTASVYEQIRALAEQGRGAEATALAQGSYADAMERRIPALAQNLGVLERAWTTISDAAKGAWDSMLNIGRPESLEAKLAAVEDAIDKAKQPNQIDNGEVGLPTLEKQRAVLVQLIADQARYNFRIAEGNVERESALALQLKTDSLREKYLSKEQLLEKEILAINSSGLSIEEKRNAIAQATERLTAKAKADRPSKQEYDALFLRQEQLASNFKQAAKEAEERQKANEAYAKSVAAMLDPLAKEADSLETQLENYGLTRTEIEANTLARLEEQRVILSGQQGYSALVEQLDREIELRKRIRDASAGLDQKKAWDEAAKEADKAAQSALENWQKTSENIGDSITDALMRGFESGKDVAENLRDSIENMFSTLVLRPIVQATVVGGLSAVGMGPAMASEGSLSGAGNLLSAGSSAWDLVSGGSGLYSSFATSGVGSALGLSSTMGGVGGMAGVMGSSGASITSLGSAIGSAIPYVGLAMAAASLLGGLFDDKGGPKKEGEFFGHIGADGTIAQESTRYSKRAASDALAAAAPDLSKLISNTITSLGGSAEGLGLKYWSSIDPEGDAGDMGSGRVYDASGNLVYKHSFTADRGEYAQELALEFQRMTLASIRATDVPAIFKEVVDGVDLAKASAEELAGALHDVQGVAQIRSAFDLIRLGADRLSLSLVETAGGVDALSQNLSSYYSTYFLESERLYNTAQQVSETFKELGESVPDSVGEFRALVEGLDLTTRAGQSAFASLMAVQQAFASVTTAVDSLKTGVAEATFDLRSSEAQAAIQQQALADAASAAGVAIPASIEQLLRLADGIDYTTEAGLQLAAAMPRLVAAFNAASGEAGSAASDQAEKAATEQANTAAAILERALASASEAVDTAFDALGRSVAAEKKRLDAAYEAQASSLNAAADAARTVRDNITSLSTSLSRRIGSVAVDNAEFELQRRIGAQQSLDAALGAAQSGQSLVPYSEQIDAALTDLARPSEDLYENFVDYARAQGRSAGTLVQLDAHAKAQKSVADLTLEAINASIGAADAQHAQDIEALDRTLENAQHQLNALNGIDQSVLGVAQAVTALAAALGAAGALNAAKENPDTVSQGAGQRVMLSSQGALLVGDTISAVGGYTGSVGAAKEIITAAFGTMAPAEFQKAAIAVGLSAAMIDEMYGYAPGTANQWARQNGLKAFAAGGVASVGAYIAGEHGPELIEATAATRIYPAEQTSALMARLNSPANQTAELVREIRELRKVVEKQAEQLVSIKTSTGATAEILDSNTGGGGPSLVRMV